MENDISKILYFDFFESGFCAEVALAIRYAIYALMFPAKSLFASFWACVFMYSERVMCNLT